jgi:hypothetical protein
MVLYKLWGYIIPIGNIMLYKQIFYVALFTVSVRSICQYTKLTQSSAYINQLREKLSSPYLETYDVLVKETADIFLTTGLHKLISFFTRHPDKAAHYQLTSKNVAHPTESLAVFGDVLFEWQLCPHADKVEQFSSKLQLYDDRLKTVLTEDELDNLEEAVLASVLFKEEFRQPLEDLSNALKKYEASHVKD